MIWHVVFLRPVCAKKDIGAIRMKKIQEETFSIMFLNIFK